jgi:hypothetical protein
MIRAAIISLALVQPAVADTYVSVAFDRGAVEYAFGEGADPEAAKAAALDACLDRAAKCRIAFTRSNACVAIAVDYSTGGYGVHRGATAAEAEAQALDHCKSFGNTACQVAKAACPTENLETN